MSASTSELKLEPLPFHAWKDEQVKQDSIEHGVFRFYREREWYWREYGRYCTNLRLAVKKDSTQAILALRPQSESKTYADGTTATGVAPLPDVSPAEQDASLAESLLTDLEAMLGQRNGASIKLRSLIRSLRPQAVEYKCRHCGVTTIEDEDGVTMHGLPAPERPIMFDPSADVPIPAPPESEDVQRLLIDAKEALKELLAPVVADDNHEGYDARDVRRWQSTIERLTAAQAKQ